MKRTNKSIVAVLSFVMLLVGLHILPSEAQATASIENKDMLNVKWQMTSTPLAEGDEEISKYNANAGDYLVRLVSSVDSLKYSKVGFILTNLETNEPKDSGKIFADRGEEELNKTVYKRIASTSAGLDYTFGPKVVDTSSEYFITAKTYINPNTEYQVQAYVIPKGSDEKVLGPSRYIKLTDHIEKDGSAKVNTVISFEATDATKYTVNGTVGVNGEDYSATVLSINGNTVKVSIPVKYSSLPSAKKFTFETGDTAIYRNLYSESPDADASWYTVYGAIYDECEDESLKREFVIVTKADLLALDGLVDNQKIQASDIIYLAADFDLSGAAWTPVGESTIGFAGIFDGNGHTVSNLEINSSNNLGLFAYTSGKAVVRDLSIQAANISGTGQNIGVIAGKGGGIFENIWVDAEISGKYIGGIIGNVQAETTIKQCATSTDTTVTGVTASNDNQKRTGGLVGGIEKDFKLKIENCTTNGTVTASAINVGGLIGYIKSTSSNNFVEIIGCTSNATVTATATYVGGIVGTCESGNVSIKKTNVEGSVMTATTSSSTNGFAQVGGVIGRLVKSTATIEECLVSGTITGLQHVGGLVGYAETSANTPADCTFTIADCHISGTMTARAGGVANTGAMVGWAQDNTANDEFDITIDVSRCLMSGSITMTNGTSQTYKSVFVGQIKNQVNLNFNADVCYVKDNLDVNEGYPLYQGTGAVTGDSGVTAYAEAELKGQNPFENNSKWTAQTDTVPTLSIFATSN